MNNEARCLYVPAMPEAVRSHWRNRHHHHHHQRLFSWQDNRTTAAAVTTATINGPPLDISSIYTNAHRHKHTQCCFTISLYLAASHLVGGSHVAGSDVSDGHRLLYVMFAAEKCRDH